MRGLAAVGVSEPYLLPPSTIVHDYVDDPPVWAVLAGFVTGVLALIGTVVVHGSTDDWFIAFLVGVILWAALWLAVEGFLALRPRYSRRAPVDGTTTPVDGTTPPPPE